MPLSERDYMRRAFAERVHAARHRGLLEDAYGSAFGNGADAEAEVVALPRVTAEEAS